MSETPKYTAVYIKENDEGYYAEGNSARMICYLEPSYHLEPNGKTGVKVNIDPDDLYSLLHVLDEFFVDYQVKDQDLNITHEQHFKRNSFEFFFNTLTKESSSHNEKKDSTIKNEKENITPKEESVTKKSDTYNLNKSEVILARTIKEKGTYIVSFLSDNLDAINSVLDVLDDSGIMPSIKELK